MILKKLKEDTSEIHNKLESSELLSHFRTKNIDLATYIFILRKFYAFFSQLEAKILQYDLELYLPDFQERRKVGLLLTDLTFFKEEPLIIKNNISPKISSLSEAFGALYVVEGSTLGGRIISSVLVEKLNIGPETGGSFFNGYGDETGAKWKQFGSSLINFTKNLKEPEEDLIVEAAKITFSDLKRWLDIDL